MARLLCLSSVATAITIYIAIMLELGFIIGAILSNKHLFIIPVVVFPIVMLSLFIAAAYIKHRNSHVEATEEEADPDAEASDVDLEARSVVTASPRSEAEREKRSMLSLGSRRSSAYQLDNNPAALSLNVGIDGHGLVVDMDYAKSLANGANSRIVQTISSMHGVRTRFSYQELVEATNNFARMAPGVAFANCQVYEGIHRNTGQRMMVKKLDFSKTEAAEKHFLAELDAASVNHHCMIQLIGFCQEDSHRFLVFEHMANGSLDKWIFGTKGSNVSNGTLLEWSKRLNIAIQVARGLTFLHDWTRDQIVKFDIDCRNIYLDETFCPKFSGFGATLKELNKLQKVRSRNSIKSSSFKFLTGGHSQVAPALPDHVAPDAVITQKSDVFSFGVVLLELVSGESSSREEKTKLKTGREEELLRSNSVARAAFAQDCIKRFVRSASAAAEQKPTAEAAQEAEEIVEEEEQQASLHGINRFVDKRLGLNFNEAEATRMVQVGLWCIQKNPQMRPTMSMVAHLLEGHFDVNNCLPKGLKQLQTVQSQV